MSRAAEQSVADQSRTDASQYNANAQTAFQGAEGSTTAEQGDIGAYQAQLSKFAGANPYGEGGAYQADINKATAGTADAASQSAAQAAQAAGEVSRICAELVFGYNCHPSWDEEEHRSCFLASELEEFEETMPGISCMAIDVLTGDGGHPHKAGPCAGCNGSSEFLRLQNKLAGCLSGSRLAKDRAADTVSKVMIPEALDYPA